MKRFLCTVLAIALCGALLAGCADNGTDNDKASVEQNEEAYAGDNGEADIDAGEDDGEWAESPAAGGSWSIFIYLCGTDLETTQGSATENLNELFDVEYSGDVNVYIQTGGTKQWQTEGIESDRIQRFQARSGGLELLDEQELTSMGDPQTLYDFLSWGVNNYPADKMGFVFWNHGGGSLAGAENDELFEGDGLFLPEMNNAFSTVAAEMEAPFEFIGFDTCLMATIEVAGLYAQYANYLVASEEIEPGGGWSYTDWVQYLVDTPQATGAELGTVICDSYYAKCESTQDEAMATLSCIDLTQIDPVVEAFDALSVVLDESTSDPQTFAEVARGISRAESYGARSPEEHYTNMIDLGHMASNVSEIAPDEADAYLAALDEALVYQVKGANRQYATGLSIFFPIQYNSEGEQQFVEENYGDISPSGAYKSFLESSAAGQQAAVEQDDFIAITEDAYIDDEGTYQMNIAPDSLVNVDQVTFSLYVQADEDVFVYLGSDNDLEMDWETGHVADNFRGVWPTLDGQYVTFNIIDSTDEYIVYSTPILLNDEKTNLRSVWVWNDPDDSGAGGYFEVLGAWAGIDAETGMAAREIIPIMDGDVVVPLRALENAAGDQGTLVPGEAIAVSGGLVLEELPLMPGDYWYQFNIIDVYGGVTNSGYAVITIDENGEMMISG